MIDFLVVVYDEINFDGRAQRHLSKFNLKRVIQLNFASNQNVILKKSIQDDSLTFIVRRTSSTLLNLLLFTFLTVYLAIKYKPKIILSLNFYSLIPGFLATRFCKSVFWYDSYELLVPKSFVNFGFREWLWFYIEKWFIRFADLVFVANKERLYIMQSYYALSRTMVFENISFDKQLQLEKLNDRVANEYINSPFRIVYAGDINYERHIDKLLKAFVKLKLDSELHIVGEGLDFLRLKKYVSSLDPQYSRRIFIYGRVPRSQLIDIYTICHIGFVGYPSVGLNNINCASNKIYEYLEGGLIVLASNNPPLERVVSECRVGLTINEKVVGSICTQIEYIKEHYIEFIENVRRIDFTEVVRQSDLEYFLNLQYFNLTDGST